MKTSPKHIIRKNKNKCHKYHNYFVLYFGFDIFTCNIIIRQVLITMKLLFFFLAKQFL